MNRRHSIFFLAVLFGAIFVLLGSARIGSQPSGGKKKPPDLTAAVKKAKSDGKTVTGKVAQLAGVEGESYVYATIVQDDGSQEVVIIDVATKMGPTIFGMINEAAGEKIKVDLTVKDQFVTFAIVKF